MDSNELIGILCCCICVEDCAEGYSDRTQLLTKNREKLIGEQEMKR